VRYRHIIVSAKWSTADHAALLLGFELASLHRSELTLLDVAPRPKRGRVPFGLDAIGLLHDAIDELYRTPFAYLPGKPGQAEPEERVDDIVPWDLLDAVDWRTEQRCGDVADTIASYANESDADLVILSAGPFRSWLALTPCTARVIERRARANVIVVRSQATAFRA
jgi:nucleotide-binding universal stress UspA family protein